MSTHTPVSNYQSTCKPPIWKAAVPLATFGGRMPENDKSRLWCSGFGSTTSVRGPYAAGIPWRYLIVARRRALRLNIPVVIAVTISARRQITSPMGLADLLYSRMSNTLRFNVPLWRKADTHKMLANALYPLSIIRAVVSVTKSRLHRLCVASVE